MTCPASSIGSTPSCSHPVADMGKLTEVHPGNYIFYGKPPHPARGLGPPGSPHASSSSI